jgi:predicted dehydrogenase
VTRWQQPIRAAIVGAGLMGYWHADAVRRIGGTVQYVVDRDAQRAARLAARHRGAGTVTQLSEVATPGCVDVVHVCTPLETHFPLVKLALEAGLHVLAEKPLAETLEATSELLSVAKANRRLLCPVHQFVFQAGVQRGLSSVRDIGPLLHVDSLACSAGAVGTFAQAPDRLIAEIIPHQLSLVARLFPGALAGANWQLEHPRQGEVRASTVLEGVSLALLVSTHGRPTANTLRLIGEHGTLEADLFHGFSMQEPGDVSRAYKVARPFVRSGQTILAAGLNLAARARRGEPAYPGLRELIERFYEAVQNGAAAPIPACETLDVASARDTLIAKLG